MMTDDMSQDLADRLMRYCAIDSQSLETSETTPSTAIQFDMLNLLVDELNGLGASDVQLTGYGTVLATIPATISAPAPTIGFLAHVDTAPAFHAVGVKPRLHAKYDGAPIAYPDAPGLTLSPETTPYLQKKVGDDIITASGATLLGADDKAGVAIIMGLVRHLLAHPGIPHGPIRVAFTPDEEIGRGVHADLPKDFGVDFAYTLDGGEQGGIEFESFSADRAIVGVKGVSTHPGTAKDEMVNAVTLAARIIQTLPQATLTPEATGGRQGFIHITEMTGTAADAEIKLILRDFELDALAAQGTLLKAICEAVQLGEPRAEITCDIAPQYRNMRYWLEQDMTPVDLAIGAYKACGIDPNPGSIRGGTDGSRLTEMGVPTPNLFTGMQDIHGPLEWISVQDMTASTKVLIKLVQLAVDQAPSS